MDTRLLEVRLLRTIDSAPTHVERPGLYKRISYDKRSGEGVARQTGTASAARADGLGPLCVGTANDLPAYRSARSVWPTAGLLR
jgi:hypothetical protein